ncbi:hypothetical protein NDU88_002243 [Pleurodeles waltl]|uniref:Uncharacterized protein n=1 Tax=Pleurodeles waltl TaxID=8319 RepID=A0AAV7WKU6_PLEWA|nr:hypothetical protein NDU88_002243 [Pleurodeles waltl]
MASSDVNTDVEKKNRSSKDTAASQEGKVEESGEEKENKCGTMPKIDTPTATDLACMNIKVITRLKKKLERKKKKKRDQKGRNEKDIL